MNRTEHLLTILGEECNETAQRASKAIRFSLEEIQTEQPLSNAQRIVYEFNDIVAIMEMLQEDGCIEKVIDREAIEKKKIKVENFLKYSAKCGTLSVSDNKKKPAPTTSKMLNKKIGDLDLSVRVKNSLKWSGVYTVRDLVKLRKRDLMLLRNCGEKSVNDIISVLKSLGLKLSNKK